MLFDSHCHLDMEPLSNEQQVAIERAFRAGVTGIINVGASMRGSKASVALAEQYPQIWASVGLHPHDAEAIVDFERTMEEVEALAGKDKVIAIGEIGLDYFNPEGPLTENQIEKQKKLFKAQLEIAERLGLPIIFHVRDAWDDFFSIIKDYKLKNLNSGRAGVVHCFTGGPKEVKRVLEAGLFVGFTGFITFEQSKFDPIRDAVKETPLDRILIETDAPFLAPEPYRGKTNEPAFVVEVARKVAEIKGKSLEEVSENTGINTKTLFML